MIERKVDMSYQVAQMCLQAMCRNIWLLNDCDLVRNCALVFLVVVVVVVVLMVVVVVFVSVS